MPKSSGIIRLVNNLTVIILTFNEEDNLAQALKSVCGWAEYVYILDSFSTDQTLNIARSFPCQVFQNPFVNYGSQRNFAITKLPVCTEWIFFLDADEYLTEPLKREIEEKLPHTVYQGFYIKRRFYFMGRWIKYGGYYPTWILRLFQKTRARVVREINEHVQIEGSTDFLEHDFVDSNRKGIGHWIEKHNRYADFEAQQLHNNTRRCEYARFWGTQAQKKQWIRDYVWSPFLPPLIRPFLYFIYRYFFRFGFLDGKEGFIYHFLQGLWFQFLIDVKYLEAKRK